MNLKTRPLLIAAGLGGAIQLIMAVAGQALSVFVLSESFSESQVPEGFAPLINVVGVGNCLCLVLLDILAGLIYGGLYPRDEPMSPGDGILGGGAAAGLARLGSGTLGLFASLLLLPLLSSQLGLAGDQLGLVLSIGLAGGIICGLLGLVVSAVIGAVLGFVGGAMAVLIRERQSGQLSGSGLL